MAGSDEQGKSDGTTLAKSSQSPDNAGTQEAQWLKYELQDRELDLEIQCQAMQDVLGELEESRNRYADLYDFAPVGYVTFDERACIREINLTGAALLGMERSRLFGMPMAVFVDKDSCKKFFDHLRSCRLSGKKVITELRLTSQNAAVTDAQLISMPLLHTDGHDLQYRTIIADTTERKLMEKEISRMDRLHLVGEMAAGIAHEIRNPMTTVRGYLQSFLRKKEFAQFNSQLELMISELDRANSIITEYLSLARNKPVNQSLQSLNEIIETLLPLMVSDALLKGMIIVTELADDIPDFCLDVQEMRQLLLNLSRNGFDAMLPGGKLTVGTFIEDEQVVLFIQDQGTGIPSELQQKLGTPFLTTKETGTGLGLPICYSIAHRHNAKIDVKTGESGTIFMVKFSLP
ncbi:two-component system sensor histidine kinase NtrB [Sporomusa sp.]|uniref:two-component system sensor histidine kinase NtrB n=1 Tax=Sporomusa sp. TaxID=2078658 RepID=UPI002CD8D7A4|nr:ATP-binding protein [Sporomusa sp.]HWR05795.1 ATP-binding protein [Sporomusa sp.]